MAKADLFSHAGKATGSVELPDDVFGIEPNVAVMHQVVLAQLAAARAGTHSTKSRAQVRGGGAKPWRQKGTGRARAGSNRSPIWVGGGRSHGPKPRSYVQRTPRKMRKLALRSALSDRVASRGLKVIDEWSFDTPKTKDAIACLEGLGIEGATVLIVVADDETGVDRSFRNLPKVSVISLGELNTYDILRSEYMVVGLVALREIAGAEIEVTKAVPKASGKADAKAGPSKGRSKAKEPAAEDAEAPAPEPETGDDDADEAKAEEAEAHDDDADEAKAEEAEAQEADES